MQDQENIDYIPACCSLLAGVLLLPYGSNGSARLACKTSQKLVGVTIILAFDATMEVTDRIANLWLTQVAWRHRRGQEVVICVARRHYMKAAVDCQAHIKPVDAGCNVLEIVPALEHRKAEE